MGRDWSTDRKTLRELGRRRLRLLVFLILSYRESSWLFYVLVAGVFLGQSSFDLRHDFETPHSLEVKPCLENISSSGTYISDFQSCSRLLGREDDR